MATPGRPSETQDLLATPGRPSEIQDLLATPDLPNENQVGQNQGVPLEGENIKFMSKENDKA